MYICYVLVICAIFKPLHCALYIFKKYKNANANANDRRCMMRMIRIMMIIGRVDLQDAL